ncbi:hypothetical protein [Pseudocitrobacter corydidari]|uniref:Uncharacterized protein n=1 Tax=Pseudocitrobacter corydidari TaxID=2891570 RepID=A0ABY3S6A9_9ENTR|nr:hypothetical protein [Pseudocitrobacter corydidari]UGS42114.1 hypothetical protein G163CM_28390 [Pseudocitrobacter corydidari]
MEETIYKLNKSIIPKKLKIDFNSPFGAAIGTMLLYGAMCLFLSGSLGALFAGCLLVFLLTFIYSMIVEFIIYPFTVTSKVRAFINAPAEIALSQNHIRVDNQCWSLNGIKTLKLTPDIYPKNEKCYLTIITHNNKKHRFYLGCGFASDEMIFENYSTFCAHVKFLFRNNTSAFKEK